MFPLEYAQVKTIAEQRIYLDEAHELHELLADKWVQALLEVGYLLHHHAHYNDHRYHFMIATILGNEFQDVMIIREGLKNGNFKGHLPLRVGPPPP